MDDYSKLFKAVYTKNKKAKIYDENAYNLKDLTLEKLEKDKKDDIYLKKSEIHFFEPVDKYYYYKHPFNDEYLETNIKFYHDGYKYYEYKDDNKKFGFHKPINNRYYLVKTDYGRYGIVKISSSYDDILSDFTTWFKSKKEALREYKKLNKINSNSKFKFLKISQTPRKVMKSKTIKDVEATKIILNYINKKAEINKTKDKVYITFPTEDGKIFADDLDFNKQSKTNRAYNYLKNDKKLKRIPKTNFDYEIS